MSDEDVGVVSQGLGETDALAKPLGELAHQPPPDRHQPAGLEHLVELLFLNDDASPDCDHAAFNSCASVNTGRCG